MLTELLRRGNKWLVLNAKINCAHLYCKIYLGSDVVETTSDPRVWSTAKVNIYYFREFQAYNELTAAIETYISFYNHNRFQKRLKGLSRLG